MAGIASASGPSSGSEEDTDQRPVVAGSADTESPDAEAEVATVAAGDRLIPSELQSREIWVVWDWDSKVARAPWQEGTMYPCEWAAEKDIDPRRSFEKAKIVSELSVDDIHHAWPFPDELPERVEPAVLLRHDPDDPPITFIDLDDVRNPDTGGVPKEVLELIEQLGGYTEISRSGTGLHTYVKGGLPEEYTTFSAPPLHQGPTRDIRPVSIHRRHVDSRPGPTDGRPGRHRRNSQCG